MATVTLNDLSKVYPNGFERVGDRIRVNVDVQNLHFFDRQIHLAINA